MVFLHFDQFSRAFKLIFRSIENLFPFFFLGNFKKLTTSYLIDNSVILQSSVHDIQFFQITSKKYLINQHRSVVLTGWT